MPVQDFVRLESDGAVNLSAIANATPESFALVSGVLYTPVVVLHARVSITLHRAEEKQDEDNWS